MRKTFRLLGIWLQTGLFVCTLLACVIGISWSFAGDIMQQLEDFDDSTRSLVNTFGRYATIGLLPMTWYGVVNNWLVSQKITMPQLVGSLSVIGANVAFNYFFIYKPVDLGFRGSPLATSISRTLLIVVIVAYVVTKKVHKTTWGGFSAESLKSFRMKRYLKLSIPLALTGSLEEGQLQLVAILAGRLPRQSRRQRCMPQWNLHVLLGADIRHVGCIGSHKNPSRASILARATSRVPKARFGWVRTALESLALSSLSFFALGVTT